MQSLVTHTGFHSHCTKIFSRAMHSFQHLRLLLLKPQFLSNTTVLVHPITLCLVNLAEKFVWTFELL